MLNDGAGYTCLIMAVTSVGEAIVDRLQVATAINSDDGYDLLINFNHGR